MSSQLERMQKIKEWWRSLLDCMGLKHFVLCYVGIVLLFAFINQYIFWKDSTAFVISEQMNKHVERYKLLEPDIDLVRFHENAKDKMPVTFEGIYEMILPDVKKLEFINAQLQSNQEDLDSCKEKVRRVSQLADIERQAAIEAFIDSSMRGYQQKIDSLQRYMIGKDTTELILNGKYVELARLRHDFAKQNAQVYQKVLEYYSRFIPDTLATLLTSLNNEEMRLTSKCEEYEDSRKGVRNRIKDTVNAFHSNRYETVTFNDFVYYSICVSTTVSFGDIAPNSGSSRLAAILELLLCLVLVGLILEKVKMVVLNQKSCNDTD